MQEANPIGFWNQYLYVYPTATTDLTLLYSYFRETGRLMQKGRSMASATRPSIKMELLLRELRADSISKLE